MGLCSGGRVGGVLAAALTGVKVSLEDVNGEGNLQIIYIK